MTNFLLTIQLGYDLPTRDRRYLAVGHTTSDNRWEQPSSSMTRSQPRYYPVLIHRTRMNERLGWRKYIEGYVGMASRGNRIRVTRMVAQWFIYYATANHSLTLKHIFALCYHLAQYLQQNVHYLLFWYFDHNQMIRFKYVT